jgi:branched-subunit amino acid transport protein AzlD
MSPTWITIAALAVGTIAARAAGPLTTGARRPSGRALEVARLVAPAILGGLVVYETFAAARAGIAFDARIAGLGAAAAALAARLPTIVVVLLAAAATALVRALA